MLAYAAWRRRIEPVGVAAAGVFAAALLLSIAFGGSPLPLELRRALFPGAVGMACLISLAVRHPLLLIVSAKLTRARPEATAATPAKLHTPGAQRALTTLTAIIGLTLVADAAAQIILALTVSTAAFGELARVASYVIIATGLAARALYLRRVRGGLQDPARSQPSA